MSILLEALRKSEKREQLGVVPGLHSQDPGSASGSPTVSGRLAWGLVAALFLVLAWLTWRQFAPVVVDPPPTRDALLSPPEQQAASGENEAGAAAPPGPDFMAQLNPKAETARQENPSQATGPRTPMESLPEPEPSAGPSEDSIADAGTRSAANTRSLEAAPAQPAERPASRTPSQATDQQAEPANPVIDAAAARLPPPVTYWQLPSNIREQLPPLRITVLVYAEQPSDRFVLLDGRRRAEGDEVQPGLRLAEIRRDGVVFTYRMYRFTVKQ